MTQPPADPTTPPHQVTLGEVAGTVAVVLAYQQATQAIRQHLIDYVTALWWSMGQWRDPQRARFVAEAVPAVEAAMGQMSSLTAGYLAAATQTRTSQLVTPTLLDTARITISGVRNGADPTQVYGRPFGVVWQHLAEQPHVPGAVDKAIEAGLERAVKIAVTDLQLGKTHAAQQVVAKIPRIVGYRRVLEGPHSCGLCIVASTRMYHKKKLMPIHPGCDCNIGVVYSDDDPAQEINDRFLGDVHQAIADRFGASAASAGAIPGQDGLRYSNVLVEHTHDEIGPVLGVRGQNFRGPADVHS